MPTCLSTVITGAYHFWIMTLSKEQREKNNELALKLIFEDLGDDPISLRIFLSNDPRYERAVDRTTWEDLTRNEYLSLVFSTEGARGYRLTARGWLLCLELTGTSKSDGFKQRLGRIIAAMKRHVKGRAAPAILSPWELANESREPFGLLFNVIDSRASSSLNSGRIGATWYKGQRGQFLEIPVDFNMEPIDIAAGLNVKHFQMIEDLELRLRKAEEDRAQFHCPDCDSTIVSSGTEDIPEAHSIVMHEHYACGRHTIDGFEESPCPYGPRWPNLDEFEFKIEDHGTFWSCYALPKTERARGVSMLSVQGKTKDDAEAKARKAAAPKKRGDPLW
jgi:hypothetical protein